MKKTLILITLLLPFVIKAQSPVSFSKKVADLPHAFEKPTDKTDPFDNNKSTSLPWIVFSDRDENYTYTAPGGTLVMKKIKFMEPFYVSESKNGYLKLIKYQAGLVQGRKLVDKKGAQSYGWINREKVLLWQSAFVSPQTGYPVKNITIIAEKNPLTMPQVYYDKTDSVYVYNSPELEHKKTKIGLHHIIYVFKKSADGRTVLVGSEGQLIADSAARSVYGWVPADAVHSWGDRLYIGSAKKDYDSDDSVAAIVNKSLHLTGNGKENLGGFYFDPLIDRDQPLMRSIPVLSSSRGDYDSGTLQLGIADDVYDKSNNSVINIKGGHLGFKDYLAIRKDIHKINVIYVVDGGSSMRNYFAGITSSIQSFEKIFNAYTANNIIKYGAVVYRSGTDCGTGGIVNEPFSGDYRNLVRFLDKQAAITSACSVGAHDQPVFEGIQSALKMFNNPNETNLIILVGNTGNLENVEPSLGTLTNQIANANARLLAIQVFSDYNSIYNDFVIQARKLVSQSAILLADKKKQHMVVGEGLTNAQQFNTTTSDSVSFYLDFPKRSLIQGAVIFPPKGVVKSNRAMEISIDRLMSETRYDIKSQIGTLDSAFRLTGREHRYVTPVVLAQLKEPVADNLGNDMPHNAFKYYLTAEAPATLVKEHHDQLQYLIILNEVEYKQLSDLLSMMMGDNLQRDASNFRSKLFKNYIVIIKKRLQLKMSRGDIKQLTLAQYMQRVTGLPLYGNPDLDKYKVSDLKNTSSMPQAPFEAYITFLTRNTTKMKQSALLLQHFTSNGKNYYYITQANWLTK
jgi:hypothetical protein